MVEKKKVEVMAQLRVLCKNGDINHAMIGKGKGKTQAEACAAAYANAKAQAEVWCVNRGGVQKTTEVRCPYQ